MPVGQPMLAAIRELFSGRRPDLLRCWQLSDRGLRLLNRGPERGAGRPRRMLASPLRPSAGRRVASAVGATTIEAIEVRVDGLKLFGFRTGVGIAELVVRLRPLDDNGKRLGDGDEIAAEALIEGLRILSRQNEVVWIGAAASDATAAPTFSSTFSLGGAVAALAGSSSDDHPRIYSLTFARLRDPAEERALDDLASRLARRYSRDYKLAPGVSVGVTVGAFESTRTTIAQEGAAILVAPPAGGAPLVPALRDFGAGPFAGCYAPACLLAAHEHAFLGRIGTLVGGWPKAREDRAVTRQRLVAARDRSLFFRLTFRFAEISAISMHNDAYRGFRAARGLEPMLQQLAGDMAEIDGYLKTELEERAAVAAAELDRRFRYIAVTTVAIGAFIAGVQGFSVVADILADALAAPGTPPEPARWPHLAAIGLAVLGGVVAGIIAQRRLSETERRAEGGPPEEG